MEMNRQNLGTWQREREEGLLLSTSSPFLPCVGEFKWGQGWGLIRGRGSRGWGVASDAGQGGQGDEFGMPITMTNAMTNIVTNTMIIDHDNNHD